MTRILLLTLFLLANSPACWATTEDSYHKGIEAFRAKKWEEAHGLFSQAVSAQPCSPSALFNLGLTEMQMGKMGSSLAKFRLALYCDSGFEEAYRVVQELSTKVDRPFQAKEISNWEILRTHLLINHTLSFFILLTAILLAVTGYLALLYLKKHREASAENLSTGFPTSLLILTILTLVAIAANVAKIVDRATTRVTVVQGKTQLHVGPGDDAVSLLELPEGNELVVQSVRSDENETWLQVVLPGSLTGWVPVKTVTLSAGRQLW